MPTTTTNYDLLKPLVNDATDEDLWGGYLNESMDLIDAQMKVNADASAAATILAAVYPVGSLYMNKTVSTNPATLLGFGTWTAITDRMIMAVGSTYAAGTTGGAATVALSSANNGPHTHSIVVNGLQGSTGTFARVSNSLGTDDNSNNATATSSVQSSGSGTPFSILNPYQTAYIWERTA